MAQTHRNPTIKDVAALAGCSVTTVSHVLNDVPGTRVKADTRERVRAAARDLAYSPNLLARGVRQNRTNTLGFVSDAVGTTPYAVRIILGAQHAAAEAGYLLMLMNAGLNADLATREIKSLMDRRVDGILYAADYHRLVDLPRNLKAIPAVLVNSRATDPGVTSVVPDEIGGTLAAVRELIASGHRRIGYLTEAGDIPASKAAYGRLSTGVERGPDPLSSRTGRPPAVQHPRRKPCRLRTARPTGSDPPRCSASTTEWPWAPTKPPHNAA